MRVWGGLVGICGIFFALAAIAQPPLTQDPVRPPPPQEGASSRPRGMPALSTDCGGAEVFAGTPVERAAFCAVGAHRYVSARTLANQALEADPRSYRAHYLMGATHHFGEANLPKALFHLEEAESLFGAAHGDRPDRDSPLWPVYVRILLELVYVHGEMDHHEAKIRYVDALKERAQLDYLALKAWPLLKLKRFDEARLVAKASIEKEESWDRAVGRTALCAIESELRNRAAAYDACKAAAEPVMSARYEGAVELSNAGAAAEEMFRFDEAERLFTEATRRVPEGSVNPWGRLVRLYLRQGRLTETVSAWREMMRYRAARAAHMDQQDQAEADLIGASLFLVAGRAKASEQMTRRTVMRPDRQGTSSAASDQNEAGAAIMDRVAKLTYARRLEEDAALAPFWESLELRAEAAELRFHAWTVGRRAAEILATPERLITPLRPECPGSVEVPAWLDAEVVHLVGPGVALAGLELARQEETLPPEVSESVFGALEGEAHWLAGENEKALSKAEQVLALLPPSEALLRGRIAAVGAEAARALDQHEDALRFYQMALSADPGVLRRLGVALPVRLSASGNDPRLQKTLDLLADTPRFDVVPWGLELRVDLSHAVLLAADGSVIATVRVPKGREDLKEGVARRIARAILRGLFAPDVDLTQADIRSLDGGLGTGGKASERIDRVLREVTEE